MDLLHCVLVATHSHSELDGEGWLLWSTLVIRCQSHGLGTRPLTWENRFPSADRGYLGVWKCVHICVCIWIYVASLGL